MHRDLETFPVLARAGTVLPLQADLFAAKWNNPARAVLARKPLLDPGEAELIEDDGSAHPGPQQRRAVRIEQWLEVHPDATATLTVTMRPERGEADVRTVCLDVVGVASADGVEAWVAGRSLPLVDPVPMSDELLAPALRVALGEVDLGAEILVRVVGARTEPRDLARDAFALIDAAEIEFSAKEAAWRAATSLGGLGLVQELAGVDIPTPLRDALVEVAAAREVW